MPEPGRAPRKSQQLAAIAKVLSWALVDLWRKLHEAARQIESGVGEATVGKSLRLWGPDTAPVLQTARRLGGRRASRLLETALETDVAMKSGRAGNPTRTLEGLAVRLAGACSAGGRRA